MSYDITGLLKGAKKFKNLEKDNFNDLSVI